MYSILHISDLHRSQKEPVDNDSLLASLVSDRDRYLGEIPVVPPPEAIVVSGDLIQGAPLGAQNWQSSIEDQYEVSHKFLADLCDRFLDGDRRRLILTPGNHDVCWNTAYGAMTRLTADQYPSDLYGALVQPGSPYRWSWEQQTLFQITKFSEYELRMKFYWDFVEKFYDDIDLLTPIDRTRGFHLFELCNRRILVAAFESIDGNDCFRYSGSIASDAVAKCAMRLHDTGHSYDMKVAVWHHSIQGPPDQSDYMDVSHVRKMIGYEFQLGLHGHQHVAGTLTQFVHLDLDQSQSMTTVGAGSLCAGVKDLPRGVNRQYNLVVVEDDFLRARIHVREMGEGEQFTRKRSGAFMKGFVDVSWQPQADSLGRKSSPQEINTRQILDDAERALKGGRISDAVDLLSVVDISSEKFGRALIIDALLHQEDWGKLITILEPPVTIEEMVILITALIESGRIDDAQVKLSTATEIDATTRADLQERLDTKKLMRLT